MYNISVIGCGKWAQTIINEIKLNNDFKIHSLVCRSKNLTNYKNIKIFKNINDILKLKEVDCIFVAASPSANLEIIELNKKYKKPLILEKPFSNSYKNSKKIKKISIENNILIMPNLTNCFSECFIFLENFIKNNFNSINKIIIYDGNFGPFRNNIHPIWDWGYHPISMLIQFFGQKYFSKIRVTELRKYFRKKSGLVSKLKFKINNSINVNVVTGNLFNKKIRKLKIYFDNKILSYDMINHKVYINDKIIYKNNKSTLQSLLNNYKNKIILEKNFNYSQKLIETSCQTTNVLEQIY